ncbi:MAG: hypothetical protein COV66_14975 [Nitrospinae bacterium CG11_big_fil_rev_8_21_14_0_20_45_15]|nr:MAG: hypothetical protein COV66_14975 [Nitrospinae bacterium CG11_big_fil_rev_8_21_14_0_20_45_15]
MALYVFECQKCKHLIKHSLGGNIGGIYIFDCPNCKDNNRFKFIREGNTLDWYSNVVKIKNNKRRDLDRLHSTEDERKD